MFTGVLSTIDHEFHSTNLFFSRINFPPSVCNVERLLTEIYIIFYSPKER